MKTLALTLALLGGLLGMLPGAASATTGPAAASPDHEADDHHGGRRAGRHERYLYVAAIAQSAADPDFIAVVGADPRRKDFGRIVNRIDMPNIGDELHHIGYSHDQKRLIVPGLFSNRMHVFRVHRNGRDLRLQAVDETLATQSGYVVPHSVIAHQPGRALVTMIGAFNGSTRPGGIVEIDDETGAFMAHYGPGPGRTSGDLGPSSMYDFDTLPAANRGISTTFGPPGACGAGIAPACLGDEVAVWDLQQRRVVQVANLGPNSGALEVRFIDEPGVRRAFVNTPGTHAVWLAEDDDGDGVFRFHAVLGPADGLLIPADMLLSYDHRFMYITNWFGNTVQQFDIRDPYRPRLTATVPVPHPNMLRLSRDNKRLYVTNSLLTTWDNDANFGPPRNDRYGIWLFHVDTERGGLASATADGRAWVDFTPVQKRHTVGPAGPHMMLFDPGVRLEPGEH